MSAFRLLMIVALAASAARGGTGRERLIELRAKLAAQSQLGRSSGWKKEIRFAASLTDEPALGARVLYDVARAQARQGTRDAAETLKTLLGTFPKTQPWAALATYELATAYAGRSSSSAQAAKLFAQFLSMKGRDPVRTAKAMAALARIESETGKREEALARCRGLLERFPGHDQVRAEALARMGRIHVGLKQVDEAAAAYERLSAEYPWETEARGSLLFAIIQAHRTAENHDAATAACQQYLDGLTTHSYERAQVYVALATLHAQQKNNDGVVATYRRMLTDHALQPTDRLRARRYLFSHHRRVGDHAAIVRAAHKLIAADPVAAVTRGGVLDPLVVALIEQGRLDGAIAMARAYFRLSRLTLNPRATKSRSGRSSSSSSGDEPAFTVVRALKAKEGGLRTANAFIQFLATGPNGPDGRLGTADDVPDPLAKWPLPAAAERDRLFSEAAKQLTAEPLKLACLHVCWDKPAEALRAFRLHYLRASSRTGLRAAATILAQAMRALGRPEAEVDAFFDFQNYGPNGKDGKPGTADDLKDPILELK